MANSQTFMSVIILARPHFRNNQDKVAFAVHASFIASGYILTATGRSAFADDALYSSSQHGVGINGWNELDGEYAFVYKNPKNGSKKTLVMCLAINDKLLVNARADGGEEPAHLVIKIEDYVKESNEGSYAAQFKNWDMLLIDLHSEIFDKLDGKVTPFSSRTQSSSKTNEEPRHDVNMPYPSDPPQIHPSGVVVVPPRPGLFPVPGCSSKTNEEPRHDVNMPYPSGPPQIHPSGVIVPPIPGLFPVPGAGMYPGSGGSMPVGPIDSSFFQFGDGAHRPGFMGPPQLYVPPPGFMGPPQLYVPPPGFMGPPQLYVPPPGFMGPPQLYMPPPVFMGPPQPGVPPPGSPYDPNGPPIVRGFEPGRFTRQPPRRPGNGRSNL